MKKKSNGKEEGEDGNQSKELRKRSNSSLQNNLPLNNNTFGNLNSNSSNSSFAINNINNSIVNHGIPVNSSLDLSSQWIVKNPTNENKSKSNSILYNSNSSRQNDSSLHINPSLLSSSPPSSSSPSLFPNPSPLSSNNISSLPNHRHSLSAGSISTLIPNHYQPMNQMTNNSLHQQSSSFILPNGTKGGLPIISYGSGPKATTNSLVGAVPSVAKKQFSPLFSQGFMPFLSAAQFSDLILIHQKKRYHVHQIILAHSSEYFITTLNTPSVLQSDHSQLETIVKQKTQTILEGSPTRTLSSDPIPMGNALDMNDLNSRIQRNMNGEKEENKLSSSPKTPTRSRTNSAKRTLIEQQHSNIPYIKELDSPKKELELDSEETTKRTIKLSFADPEEVFPLVLEYMYNGSITLSHLNAIPLLKMADYLIIEDLRSQINDFLLKNISKENVLENLRKALIYDTKEIIERCILVLAKNFSSLYTIHGSSFINFLPLSYCIPLLNHASLAVASESSIFQTIISYLNGSLFVGNLSSASKERNLTLPIRSKELSSTEKNEEDSLYIDSNDDIDEGDALNQRGCLIPYAVRKSLFSCVRLPYLEFEDLGKAMKETLLPKSLLMEALMVRIASHECKDQAKSTVIRLQKRATSGIHLEYKSDMDENGVLHWIGTKGGVAKWRNPCVVENGIIITTSSFVKGDPTKIASKKPSDVWTDDVPSSWCCVDLGKHRSLLPNHYTLRHGGLSRMDCLRNWVLQASNNGTIWDVLQRRRDDKALDANYSSYSWPIDTATKAYRFFRILQTGHNSSNHNFLSLSGIEFYGELYEQQNL